MATSKIKTVYFKTRQERTAIYKQAMKGLIAVGSGAFATVYTTPRLRHVIKIGGGDEGYVQYAKEIIKANSRNPYLPKIHSLTLVKAKGPDADDCDNFFIVKMEKLLELHHIDNDDEYEVARLMEQIVRSGKPEYHLRRQVNRTINTKSPIPKAYEVQVKMNPSVIQFLKHLSAIAKSAKKKAPRGVFWDIHTGNVMLRANGQLVLTDPLA